MSSWFPSRVMQLYPCAKAKTKPIVSTIFLAYNTLQNKAYSLFWKGRRKGKKILPWKYWWVAGSNRAAAAREPSMLVVLLPGEHAQPYFHFPKPRLTIEKLLVPYFLIYNVHPRFQRLASGERCILHARKYSIAQSSDISFSGYQCVTAWRNQLLDYVMGLQDWLALWTDHR